MATATGSGDAPDVGQEERQDVNSDEPTAAPAAEVGQGDERTVCGNGSQASVGSSTIPNTCKGSSAAPCAKQPPTSSHVGVELIAKDLRGTVKWYNALIRYGFIVRADTQHDVFVHRNSIVMAPGEPAWLNADQPVTFDLWTLPCGRFDAKNVRSASGTPISFGNVGPSMPQAAYQSGSIGQRRSLLPQHGSVGNVQHYRQTQYSGRPHGGAAYRGQYVYCPGCGRELDFPFVRPRATGVGFKPNAMNVRVPSRS